MLRYRKLGCQFCLGVAGWSIAIFLALAVCRVDAAPLSVENELLLDVKLDGASLGTAILGYQGENQVWLSLSELADVLQFPINTDADAGLAGGWFIQEERAFSLDLSRDEVISGERDFVVDDQAQAFQNDIFVTIEALESWFPVLLVPNIRQLELLVETTELIPLQNRLSRSRSRPKVGALTQREAVLPFQETPYRVLGAHATDIRLNLNSVLDDEDDSSTSYGGNYSVLSRGDFAWMTSTLAFSGSKNDEVSDGRFKLERSNLNAPLKLDYIEVGDVDAGARGVLIRGGGAEEGRTGLFADEQIDLRGNVPPDWEVELYRNGILVDFQVVDSKAQYEFLDVPLEFGENRFELVLYGPFGEERREERVYFAGRSDLELGEVSYELAALQDGRTVFDVKTPAAKGEVNTARFLADFNIGLASNAVASVGVDSFVADGQREQDLRAGVSVNYARVQTSAGYQNRAMTLDEATGLIRASLGDTTTTTVRYTHYLKGGLDEVLIPTNRPLWSGDLGLSTRLGWLPLNFDGRHTERETSRATDTSLGTTVTSKSGTRLSKSFFYTRNSQIGVVNERSGGVLNMSATVKPWRFRAGIGYGISPDTELNSLSGSASVRVDSKMTMNFDINHSARTDYTNYRAGFNWLLDYVQISPQVIYDSNERWVGLVSLSTSLVPRPGRTWPHIDRLSQANYGAAYALAFMDENGNGIRDDGEPGLNNVRVDAVQNWRVASTQEDGQSYLMRLRQDRVTDIAIDSESLPGIDMWSESEGVSVEPRPGSWSQVNFPVIRTSELEGHVYSIDEGQSANRTPSGRVLVQLLNKAGEVVSAQRTAFDGFYLFAEVPPGVYQLDLGNSWQPRIDERPAKVGVSSQGGVIRNLDFVLSAGKGRQIIEKRELEAQIQDKPEPIFAPRPGVPDQKPKVDLPSLEQPVVLAQTGNWHIQLGAFSKRENALEYWAQLLENDVIPGVYESRLEQTGRLFRLLTAPGQTEAEARGLCDQIKVKDTDCLVRKIAKL